MGAKYMCAWCDKKFDRRWDRSAHEGSCEKMVVPKITEGVTLPSGWPAKFSSSAVDPLAVPSVKSIYEDMYKSSGFKVDAPTAEQLMLIKFDDAVSHLLVCIKSTSNPDSINAYTTALDIVVQSKDILYGTQEESK